MPPPITSTSVRTLPSGSALIEPSKPSGPASDWTGRKANAPAWTVRFPSQNEAGLSSHEISIRSIELFPFKGAETLPDRVERKPLRVGARFGDAPGNPRTVTPTRRPLMNETVERPRKFWLTPRQDGQGHFLQSRRRTAARRARARSHGDLARERLHLLRVRSRALRRDLFETRRRRAAPARRGDLG
jgi:hypothetical protein